MLAKWTFRFYVSASGRRVVEKWYEEQDDAVQAKFDAVLEYLSQRDLSEWIRPDYAPLSGRQSGLGELRFSHGGKVYRPLGCFGPERFEFTILIGCSKKGRRYDPPDALDTALDRKKFIAEIGRTHVYEI